MPTTAKCPQCGIEMAVPADLAGDDVECPGCGRRFQSMPEPLDDSDERPRPRRRRRHDEIDDFDRPRLERRREAAEAAIKAPAIGLMVVGLLQLIVMGILAAIVGSGAFFNGAAFGIIAIASYFTFEFIRSAITVYGSMQMMNARSYGWGMAAAIIMIIPSCCHLTPWTFWLWFLNLGMGVWALVVLNNSDVRERIRRRQREDRMMEQDND